MVLTTTERIKRALIQLQHRNSFWAYLSLFLKFKECKKGEMLMDTMGVDPRGNVTYVKEFINELSDDELIGVITHEVCHMVFLSQLRKGSRDQIGWNFSSDLTINTLLKKNNFSLPKGGVIPDNNNELKIGSKTIKDCDKKIAEEVYDELPKTKMKGNVYVIGNGKDIGKELGKAFDNHLKGKGKDGKELSPKEKRELKKEWNRKIHEALSISQMRGDTPKGMERLIKNLHKEQIDWKTILTNFITNQIPYDYTWQKFSKKSIACQIPFPANLKEKIKVGICIDVSGSIGQKELTDFLSEVIGMAKAYRERIDMRLLTHEVEINNEYEISNGNISKILDLKIKGGGGTSHIQPFNFIKDNIRDCKAVVFLTDGYSDLNSINFNEYPFAKLFVISKDGDDSQLKGKNCHTIKLK